MPWLPEAGHGSQNINAILTLQTEAWARQALKLRLESLPGPCPLLLSSDHSPSWTQPHWMGWLFSAAFDLWQLTESSDLHKCTISQGHDSIPHRNKCRSSRLPPITKPNTESVLRSKTMQHIQGSGSHSPSLRASSTLWNSALPVKSSSPWAISTQRSIHPWVRTGSCFKRHWRQFVKCHSKITMCAHVKN